MTRELVLPSIYIEKGEERYNVHWDYNSTEADEIIFENHDYLLGYILGYFESLSDGKEIISCISSNTGTIRNLKKENAEKMELMLINLLHPLVKKRHEKLLLDGSHPYNKLLQEQQTAQ